MDNKFFYNAIKRRGLSLILTRREKKQSDIEPARFQLFLRCLALACVLKDELERDPKSRALRLAESLNLRIHEFAMIFGIFEDSSDILLRGKNFILSSFLPKK